MVCKQCGAELNEGAQFCSVCGAKVAQGADAAQGGHTAQSANEVQGADAAQIAAGKKGKKPVVVAVAAILIVLAVAIGGVLLWIYSPINRINRAIEAEDIEQVAALYGKLTKNKDTNRVQTKMLKFAENLQNDYLAGKIDFQEVTEGYDLPEGTPVFLFVGRMMWYKGIRISLDALKMLKDEGRDFRMVFVGGGTDKEEIVAYSHTLGLDGCVFFSDPIHDRNRIRAWYCRADLFLFPSTFDTNGLVVREAAACALGSVLVAGSCAAEDVTDGVNGLLIEENAESMASCLRALCENPAKMKEVGENAQRDIYISWDDAVKGAVERYGTVIENYRAGHFPKHETPQDEMLSGIGALMNLIGTGESRQQEIRDHLAAVLEGRRPTTEWLHPFNADITHAVFRPMEKSFAEWREKNRLPMWLTGQSERNPEARKKELFHRKTEQEKKDEKPWTSLEEGLEEYFDIFL